MNHSKSDARTLQETWRAGSGVRQENLRVWLLGGFRVSVGSREVDGGAWRLRKAANLVKILALADGHRLHRLLVMDALWPDLDEEAQANNLYRALHFARRALVPAGTSSRFLTLSGETLALCPEDRLWVDAEAFEEAAATARRARDPSSYRAAIGLYSGELLPEDLYEAWAEERRRELQETNVALLVELAGLHEDRREYEPAIETLRLVVADDPMNQQPQTGLVRLYALTGRHHEALPQYDRLRPEPRTEPDATSRRFREEIVAGRSPPGPPPAWPQAEAGETRHNLPASRSSFVGRRRELVEVKRGLTMTALLTLTGAGGSGKTRLALEAARDLVGIYPGGVRFVALAPLADGELVPRVVAERVGAHEEPGRPLELVIAEVLRDTPTLLLLDNCEHVVDAVARLLEVLIPASPRLKVLATSREHLGVGGETVWKVPPLSLPEIRSSVDELRTSEAARLFVDRAAPGFDLIPENARAVADVCAKLEGMPLAIELAAARTGVLSPGQIAERLDDALRLLTTGDQDAGPRQQTLRGALDWSHDLLSDGERTLFRRLSVFAGGFTLEAAQTVGGGADDVLDPLVSLVDKSLVVAEAPMRARYRLLEPIRQYALEKLGGSDGGEAVRSTHASYFLRLVERAEPELTGAEQEGWLERLELDHDNVRAAMGWYASTGETEALLRMTGALWRFWCLHGHYSDGLGWLEQTLSAGGAAEPVLRAKALAAAGDLAFLQTEYGRAVERLEEGLVLYRALKDRRGVASAVQILGSVAREQGSYGRAETYHEESLALWRELGDDWGVAQSLNYLGFVALLREDCGRATALCTQTLSMFRALGDGEGIAWSLIMLGATALYEDDRNRAANLLEEGLALSRRTGYREGVAWALNELGILARREGRPERAEALLCESLGTHKDLGDRWRTASLLEELAGTSGTLGRFERAAILFGVTENLREALSAPVPPCERADRERDVAALRAAMDESSFRAAWRAGREITLVRAYEFALRPEPPGESQKRATAPPALTAREEEIAGLIARGLTNRHIAQELCVSPRTVDTHVGRILKKLGLHSRGQVADRLVEQRRRETG